MLTSDLLGQVIDVSESAGTIKISTRKTKASPHAVTPATATSTIRPRSGGRRALGIAAGPAKRGYRPDLRTVSFYTRVLFVFVFLLRFSSVLLDCCLDALSLEPTGIIAR
jgi:hypothetical protein